MRGLFLFHRDLRIQDNIGLNNAIDMCDSIYTCFIFTPEQVSSSNKYRSNNAIQFMIESIEDLGAEINSNNGELLLFYGKQLDVLKNIIKELHIESLHFNKDYTPYAVDRDIKTSALCEKLGVKCFIHSDYYLYEPGTVVTSGSKTPYKKYTPFLNEVLYRPVKKPFIKRNYNFIPIIDTNANDKKSIIYFRDRFVKQNDNLIVHGGRRHAILKLYNATMKQKKYDQTRDNFSKKTTHLSAFIKFGCISIREVYHSIKSEFGLKHGIIRELIWREFFAHVLYGYPEVVGQSYQPKYRSLKWSNNNNFIDKWKRGMTGFPIVDAGMRELNATGYMHNRGRMIAASVLIKTLLIDWRIGEQYFATKLTDYDIASNNGNWQGISGTGVDMKPYFRDMNPWIQSSKHDIHTEYIKKWIPELKTVCANDIHKWYLVCDSTKYKSIDYTEPIVDYYLQKKKMISMYENT